MEAMIVRTWSQKSCDFGDALECRNPAYLEIHLETEIEWTPRCTWRPGLSDCGDALGGRDRGN